MIGLHPAVQRVETDTSGTRDVLQEQVRNIVLSLQSAARFRTEPGAPVVRHISVGQERYRLIVELLPPNERGESVPVVTVERVSDDDVAERTMRERFRLTHKETRVALLLAQRRSNAEIAETLHISPHTARRHTENVMLKLNVTSRYSVESALVAVA